jgi:beta-lactamase class A
VAGRLIIALALIGSVLIASACAADRRALDPSAASRSSLANAALTGRLDALVSTFRGGAGIWVGDPTTSTPLYVHLADEKIVAASLYKLAVLVEAERRIDAGTLRRDQVITIQPEDLAGDPSVYEAGTDLTVDQALEAMITISDNGTALALWRTLGADAIRGTVVKAGMSDLLIDVAAGTAATPRAVGAFFTLLAKKVLVSSAASERMLARLGRQRINDRLPAGLPSGVVVAHKTGDLAGLTHDAGIIFTRAGPRVVVVMTWNSLEDAAHRLIADVGAAVYQAAAP